MSRLYETIFEFHLNPEVYKARTGIWGDMYGKSFMDRLKTALGVYLKDLYQFVTITGYDKTAPPPATKRWVVIGTKNHSNALGFLSLNGDYSFVSNSGFPRSEGMSVVNWSRIPKVFYLPRYLPFIFRQLVRNSQQFKRALRTVLLGVGEFENAKRVLSRKKPELIVVANDHTSFYRALTLAARSLKIPVVYIQHACVCKDFPSLIFDLSLLEGQDSYDKYVVGKKTIYGEVNLIGMPKMDRYVQKGTVSRDKVRIGIPYNIIVSPRTVEVLTEQLLHALPNVEIVVRPHPGDTRPVDISKDDRVSLSKAANENPLEFIRDLTAIIAPNSSICLEAALLDVHPLFYGPMMSSDERANDVYGFQENGLVDFCPDLPSLISKLAEIIANPQPLRERAAYYCTTVGTEDFGRSAELAVRAINKYLEEQRTRR